MSEERSLDAIFFTGFPGFLGSELLPRVLARAGAAEAVCLVQPKYAAMAWERAAEIEGRRPELTGRIRIVEGDIAEEGLGLAPDAVYRADVVEVFHLAAVYDLSVGRDFAMKVNVGGTRNVLRFARACPRLRRLQYVSTCYVSGRYRGIFTEGQLDEGQTFNNFYEETKYLAELEVQEAMRGGLPATIYRPSIVVGDSETGATQKYDGPYFAIRWLLRQPRVAVMPVVGTPSETELNVVPRDFVVRAIAHLSAREDTEGRVYALADPAPLTVDEMIREIGRITERAVIRLPLPLSVAKAAIDHVPGVYPLMQIPSSSVDYFVHPTRYDTRRATEALRGSGIHCPRFPEYSDRLVRFVRSHPEIGSAAMA